MVTTIKTAQFGHRPSMMRFTLCIAIAFLSYQFAVTNTATAATEISQFGITWTFDQSYTTGQFANGDYWVVGPVTIIGIAPPSTQIDGRTKNGSMINPSPNTGKQGFDSNISYYDATLNKALNVNTNNPLIVPVNSSLVSVISHNTIYGFTWLSDAAVLTVLNVAPDANSFRPPYCGADKTIKFNKSDLDYTLLGTLSPASGAPTMDVAERIFERPWLDYWPGSYGNHIHPSNNMQDYGRGVSSDIGIGALMLNCNFTNAQKETLMIRFVQLGIDFYGITQDTGGNVVWTPDGGHAGGRKWPILFAGLVLNDANMKNIGQKSGDYLYSDSYGAGNVPADYIHFGEDSQTFYVKAADIYSTPYTLWGNYPIKDTTGTVKVTNGSKIVEGVGTHWKATLINPDPSNYFVFGVVGDNQAYDPNGHAYKIDTIDSNTQITLTTNYTGDTNQTGNATYMIDDWVVYGHGNKGNKQLFIDTPDSLEYVQANLGLPEFGLRHATIPIYDSADWVTAAYRQQGTANCWQGQILSALIMGAKTLWNHNALFDYEDRYMAKELKIDGSGQGYQGQRSWDAWTGNMWDTYRTNYGSIWAAPGSSNKPPNADAGSDRNVTDSDQSGSEQVTLDGSGSSDPDGSIVSYIWSEGGSQIATGVKPTVSLPIGRHTITLKVTDNSDLNDIDTVVITVEAEEGLVGHWKFEDGSGLYAIDSSGYSITGRLLNSPLWTTQGEISFDGNNDAVEINTATLNISSGTVALWVNPRGFAKSKHYLFGHLTQSANNRIQLFCNASGTLGVGLGNNASLNTNIQTLNTQEWYHIALTWSNTSYAVFVDGQQKASGMFSGISAKQTYADIGNSGNGSKLSEAFYGLIDEVRLYNRALSADEVANHALVFLPIGNKTIGEGEILTFPVKTKFGTIVEVSDSNLPYNPSFTSNVFTWTPDYDDAGTYEVEFTAPHGSGEDFERITVTVTDTQQQEPVGNWKFDETSGDTASDSSTTGNTGYLRNGLAWSSGVHNGAITFSVPNDAVEIQTTKLNPQYGTIAMWVYMDNQTLSRHYLFGHANSTLTNRIQLYLKYGNLCLGLGNSHETRTDIQQLQTQQWYHIALTWSEGNYNVYVNGALKATGTYSGLTGLANHADIGNNGVTRDKGLNGSIDDVMIYNRALNADEIASLAIN